MSDSDFASLIMVLLIVAILAVIAVGVPFLVIWAINTVFGLGVPFNLWTAIAIWVLLIAFGRAGVTINKRGP